MYKKIVGLVVVLLSGAMVAGAQNDETTPEPSTFFLTFVPNVQFSQMYVGLERGYFADAGYDLTLEYGAEPDGVELIALGERDFGLIAGEQVIVARANERPIVSVYEWWQEYPIVVMTGAESGIETPADLVGRTVGVPGRFGATYAGLIALLSSADLTEADINLQEIGYNAPEVLCVGGVEAATVYGNNEPLQVAQRSESGDCDAVEMVQTIPVADYVDLVSNGLVTNETLIGEQPERVRAMVAAYDQAVRDVINNPFAAYLIDAEYIDNLPLTDDLATALNEAAAEQAEVVESGVTRADIAANREELFTGLQADFPADELLQLQVLMETVPLWEAEQLGVADAASWDVTQDVLLQMGFVDEGEVIDVTEAFTNEFLPGASD